MELDSTTGVALLYSVTMLVSACSVVRSAVIPDGELNVSFPKIMLSVFILKSNPIGVLHMECRERYFMVTVDLSFTGEELRFEAVGE